MNGTSTGHPRFGPVDLHLLGALSEQPDAGALAEPTEFDATKAQLLREKIPQASRKEPEG